MFICKFNKRREITYILAVYVDDILITGTEEEIHKNKKISEREIPDHRCRWSQFYYLSKFWKMQRWLFITSKKKNTPKTYWKDSILINSYFHQIRL